MAANYTEAAGGAVSSLWPFPSCLGDETPVSVSVCMCVCVRERHTHTHTALGCLCPRVLVPWGGSGLTSWTGWLGGCGCGAPDLRGQASERTARAQGRCRRAGAQVWRGGCCQSPCVAVRVRDGRETAVSSPTERDSGHLAPWTHGPQCLLAAHFLLAFLCSPTCSLLQPPGSAPGNLASWPPCVSGWGLASQVGLLPLLIFFPLRCGHVFS